MNRHFVPLSATFQPMLWVAGAFSLGICAGHEGPIPTRLIFGLATGCFVLGVFGFVVGLGRSKNMTSRFTTGLLLLGIGLVGGVLVQVEEKDIAPDRIRSMIQHGALDPSEPVEVIGMVTRPPENAPERIYLDLAVQHIKILNRSRPARGLVRLMIPLADETAIHAFDRLGIEYGTRVRVLTFLRRASRYRNPGSLDFTEFLDRKGYDAAGVLKSPRLITVLARGQGHPALARLYQLRRRAETSIDIQFSGQTAAVLKAVMLGNRHFLDRGVAELFRAGGTFHILVISGMHVGVLAGILFFIASSFSRNRWWRFLFSSSLLWIYVGIVGTDQTPVVRAATMVTIALAAPLIFRTAQAGNSIGLAAFILLVVKPDELFAPGFQLTFLAVIAMVLVAFPVVARLRAIGQWRPAESTPEPPNGPAWVRWISEVLFWDQRAFDRDMKLSPIRYRLDKAPLAVWLSRWWGLQTILKAVSMSVLFSTIVQVVMLPVMVLYFHRVAVGGIILNIVVTFLVCLFIISAMLTFAAAQIGPPLTLVTLTLVTLTNGVLQILKNSMMPMVQLHWASFRVAEYGDVEKVIYGVYFLPLLIAVVALHRWQPCARTTRPRPTGKPELEVPTHNSSVLRPWGWVLGVVVFAGCMVIVTAHPGGVKHEPGWLTISFLDVDQGDAAVVHFPGGTTMLIDSGGRFQYTNSNEEDDASDFIEDTLSVGEAVVSNYLWAQGIERVDYLLPTHADADHIQGFRDILKNFSVGRVLLPRSPAADPEFQQFEQARLFAGVPVQWVGAGNRFEIEGVIVDILWPPLSRNPSEPWGNDESVVLKMKFGGRIVLLTGDITRAIEEFLVAGHADLGCDLLKVPHHGSRTSSSEKFIDRVQPQFAIVSVGEHSPFGHPHREVIQRYRSHGVNLLQTGRQGTVFVRTDGELFVVTSFVQ